MRDVMGLLDIIKNKQSISVDEEFHDKIIKFIKDVFDKNKNDKEVKGIVDKFFKENIK